MLFKRGTRARTRNYNHNYFNQFISCKRSQLTIFMIIAILIIAVVALFFVFKGRLQIPEKISPEVAPIQNFVQECLEEVSESAVFEIAKQGGYNDPGNITSAGITYYVLNGENLMPSKEQLENEISDYVNRKFFLCSLNFADFPDYEIEQGNFETKTRILDNKVIFDVTYPLTIRKVDSESALRTRDFHSEVSIRFGLIYNLISNFIIQDINSKGVCITCLTNAQGNTKNLYVEMNSTNEGVIFNFIDEDSKLNNQSLKWIFANKY